jgi:hypothetical protein
VREREREREREFSSEEEDGNKLEGKGKTNYFLVYITFQPGPICSKLPLSRSGGR